MEIDKEEVQLVEEGMKAGSLDENGDEKKNETKISDEPEPATRIVKNCKRPEGRIPVVRVPTKFAVSPIAGELIPSNEIAEHMRMSLTDPKYREQKEKMMAKIRETTLAQDDEISSDIVGPARTRSDIFGMQAEEDSNPVKAEIEKLKEEQPKQVIWYGHTGSIGPTANQAMSQSLPGEELSDFTNKDEARNLPGPAPQPIAGIPSIRPLPLPPGLAPNISWPPGALECSIPTDTGVLNAPQPKMPVMPMIPLNIPQSRMLISSIQHCCHLLLDLQCVHLFQSPFQPYPYHLHQGPHSHPCPQLGHLYRCTCLRLLCTELLTLRVFRRKIRLACGRFVCLQIRIYRFSSSATGSAL